MTEKSDKSIRKGIYILPNLLTTGALFAGFSAIVQATKGNFEVAAILIFIAMVLDGLDGRVARMTNTTSEFGIQYDSLSDMVSFGLAPALQSTKPAVAPTLRDEVGTGRQRRFGRRTDDR